MNAQSYVQTRCSRCGAAAWGHVSQSVPCGSCGNLIPALAPAAAPMPAPMPAAAPAPQPQAAPQVKVNVPVGFGGFKIPVAVGGGSRFKIIGGVIAVIAIGVGIAVVKGKVFKIDGTAKGNLSYKSLGLDPHKMDPDKMIASVEATAKKWKGDAVWWGVNYQQVHADGTVDSANGGNEVTYISLNGVQSNVKSVLSDSAKKFEFGPSGVSYDMQWGPDDPWEDVQPPPTPGCGIKDVIKIMNKRGLEGDKTVRIDMDPGDLPAWRVMGEDPKVDTFFSLKDCSEVTRQ